MNGNLFLSDRGHHGDLGVTDAPAGLKQPLILARLAAARDDVFPGRHGAVNLDGVFVRRRVLHHDYGVGSDWHRRAGHDLDALAIANCALETAPRPDLP